MVYAYPRVDVNHYDWSYSWKFAKIFYPRWGDMIPDLARIDEIPDLVVADFCDVAEQDMLEQKETFLEYYGE